MSGRKKLILGGIILGIGVLTFIGFKTLESQNQASSVNLGANPSVLRPIQGGTGLGSATAGQVGTCLKVLDDSPFTYELGTCGAGGGVNDWKFPTGFSSTAISPTTSVGIYITASSTISKLRVSEDLSVSAIGDFTLGGQTVNEISVPYTGATAEANVGGNVFTAAEFHVNSTGANPAKVYGAIKAEDILTVTRNFQLPDKSGTFAMTSDITGGTNDWRVTSTDQFGELLLTLPGSDLTPSTTLDLFLLDTNIL